MLTHQTMADTEMQSPRTSSPLPNISLSSPTCLPSPRSHNKDESLVLPAINEPTLLPDTEYDDPNVSPSKRIPAPLNLLKATLPSFESLGFDAVSVKTPHTPWSSLTTTYHKQSLLRETLEASSSSNDLVVPSFAIQPATPLVAESSATAQGQIFSTPIPDSSVFEIDPALVSVQAVPSRPINIINRFAPQVNGFLPATQDKGMRYGNISSA